MANTLEYLLKLQDGAFTGPLNRARSAQGQFIREGKDISDTSARVGRLGAMFGTLAASIGVASAAFAGLRRSINAAADMESTQVAFETMLGSADKAATTLARLKKLGAETPFEFPELAAAGRSLIAFGDSAEQVANTLRRVGDVASGVQAPIGEIAEIYGKARVQGTLFAEDINQLTGRGIPIIQEFAKQLGVSDGEIKSLAADGKITFGMLDNAFRSLTSQGGKFFGMMQKQSGTMNGLWSTLKDNIGEIFVTLGKPINDSLKPWLQKAIGAVSTVSAVISQSIAQGKIGESIYHAFQLGRKMGFNAIIEGFRQLPGLLVGSLEKLGKMISAALVGDIDMVKSVWKSVMDGSFKLDTSEHTNYFKNLISGVTQVKDVADDAAASIEGVAAAVDKTEAKTSGKAGSGGQAGEGRKKIMGFSYAKSGANAGFGGLDEFWALQNAKELGYKPGELGRFKGGSFTKVGGLGGDPDAVVKGAFGKGAFSMPKAVSDAMGEGEGGKAPMKKTYMGGGLDEFHAKNGTTGYALPKVNVQSPGTVKKQQERRDTAASQARAAGGSSAAHPLAGMIAAMKAKLDTLAVAT